ncbi:hypothetical protein OC835_001089 [Tilletia horrida]|nr:hypothetical protein OC835_001089 [Tilletia horrida]
MPTPRASAAGARPSQGAIEGTRSRALILPSTPVRDLRVRPAEQVTPLTGNARKRPKETLLALQQLSPTRPPPRSAAAAEPSHHPPQAGEHAAAQPAGHTRKHTPSAPVHPAARPRPQRSNQQQQNQGADAAATSAARSARVPGHCSSASDDPGPRTAQPDKARGAQRPKSRNIKVPEKLRQYRLLGSSSSCAYDVAARGGIKDNRVFVLLPEDHPARGKPYWYLRELANQALAESESDACIATIDEVKSGLALTLTRTSKTSEVMRHARTIQTAFNADDVVLRKPSLFVVISGVPTKVGNLDVSANLQFLQNEIELALDTALVCAPRRLCKAVELAARSATAVWAAISPDDPDAARPRRIRLMNERCHVRPFPTFDTAVNGFIVPVSSRLHHIKQAATLERRKIIKNLQQHRSSNT